MKPDGRLEGDEQKELVVSSALHPVLGRVLTLAPQGVGFGAVEQDLDGAGIFVRVQELAAAHLYLICDVTVAPGDLGTLPQTAGVPRAPAERLDLGGELLDHLSQFAGVGALHPLSDLSIAEQQECGEGGDAVFLGEVLVIVAVDLDKGYDVGAG